MEKKEKNQRQLDDEQAAAVKKDMEKVLQETRDVGAILQQELNKQTLGKHPGLKDNDHSNR